MLFKVSRITGEYHEFDDSADPSYYPPEIFEDCSLRPSQFHLWIGGAWIEDTQALLESVKTVQICTINTSCAAEITGGFTSSALGTPHTYDSEETDQLNLIGAVSLGVDIMYRCADSFGTKDFRLHTAAQLKQVANDGAVVKLTALQKASLLKAQIDAAGTLTEVGLVVW